MKKSLLFSAAFLAACSLQAQVYKADTAFTTDMGASGAKASCSFTGSINNIVGMNHNRNSYYLLAEDFTVPTGQTWNLDTVILYSYQTGSGTSPSPINFATLQIRQGSVNGTVVFGDTTTNRLAASSWAGIYRVSPSNLTDVNRPVMQVKVKLTPTKTLTAGTYWLIWGCKGSGTGGVFCPQKVTPTRSNPAGQNGQQHNNNLWHNATDTLTGPTPVTVGFNYILKGSGPTGVVNSLAELNALEQNQPNPFTASTTIAFNLPESSRARLSIYNGVGQLVRVLFEGQAPAGRTETVFDATGLAAGTYFYRLQSEQGMQSMQMTLRK